MCTPQAVTLSNNLAVGTTTAEQMLRAWVKNTIVLPKGALVTTNKADEPTITALKGIKINMAALPWETLYVLQDAINAKLQARERCALQALSEKRINMEQLILERDGVVLQNRQLVQLLDEACQRIPEMAILADTPIEARIHRLATGVHKAQEEMTKVQLELNLQIAEMRLKAQPSTPLEVREQCVNTITMGLDKIKYAPMFTIIKDSTLYY